MYMFTKIILERVLLTSFSQNKNSNITTKKGICRKFLDKPEEIWGKFFVEI